MLSFNGAPISSATIERIRRSLRLSESATAASNERARPSQFKNDPLFSVIAATGRTTSARIVTSLGAISRQTTNAVSSAAKAAWLLLPSSGSTPPTSNAPMAPELTAAKISSLLRPICDGRADVPHNAAISTRAAASATGRPPGNKLPIAPASIAPRSPARRGIQAIFAPVESANAATAVNAPALSDARSPTRIIDLGLNAWAAIAAAS